MKIILATHWDCPNSSAVMTAYNIGMLRFAAETVSVEHVVSKINELYQSAKNEPLCGDVPIPESKLLIDDVISELLRLGHNNSDFYGWPTISGPRSDGFTPDIRNIKIDRKHLIRALTPIRRLF